MSDLLNEKLGVGPESEVEEKLALKLATEWHSLFCPKLLRWVKDKPKNCFRWEHVSRDVEGDEAKSLYSSQKARTYFIMPEEFGHKRTTIYQTDELPEYGDYLLDFYVFPKNMAWSMAFTHESGPKMMNLGPFFLKHPDYKSLQRKNEESLRAKGASYPVNA